MKRRALTLIESLAAIAIVGLLIALLLPCIQAARESSRRIKCSTNLRQMALALHHYADLHGTLPAYSRANYSFHVAILPHLEQGALYDQFDFTVNGMDYKGPLRSKRIAVFECPSDGSRVSDASGAYLAATNYYGNSGSGMQRYGFNGIFSAGTEPERDTYWLPLSSVTDGLSQTSMLAEVAAADGSRDQRRGSWSLEGSATPDEFESFCQECQAASQSVTSPAWLGAHRGRPWIEVSVCLMLYNHVLTPNSSSCFAARHANHSIWTSTSLHGPFVNSARCDGSVAAINQDIDLIAWRKLGSRSGVP